MSHYLTSYGTFLLPLRLESASKNTLFRGPFGGLDDHYPSVPKRNKTPTQTGGLGSSGMLKGGIGAMSLLLLFKCV